MKLSPQNSFCLIVYLETIKAYGSENSSAYLPIYPTFEDEKLKRSDEKLVKTLFIIECFTLQQL